MSPENMSSAELQDKATEIEQKIASLDAKISELHRDLRQVRNEQYDRYQKYAESLQSKKAPPRIETFTIGNPTPISVEDGMELMKKGLEPIRAAYAMQTSAAAEMAEIAARGARGELSPIKRGNDD